MARDLRNTEAARVLEAYFDKIAQGNEGDATIELLELDGTELRFHVQIRHRHVVWIKVGPIKKKVVLYSLTTHAKGKVDVLHPDPSDLRVCVDTPVGQMCVTLEDVIKLVIAAAGL